MSYMWEIVLTARGFVIVKFEIVSMKANDQTFITERWSFTLVSKIYTNGKL